MQGPDVPDMKFILLFVASFAAASANAQSLPASLTDAAYFDVNEQEARLGQLLFYDPIL